MSGFGGRFGLVRALNALSARQNGSLHSEAAGAPENERTEYSSRYLSNNSTFNPNRLISEIKPLNDSGTWGALISSPLTIAS